MPPARGPLEARDSRGSSRPALVQAFSFKLTGECPSFPKLRPRAAVSSLTSMGDVSSNSPYTNRGYVGPCLEAYRTPYAVPRSSAFVDARSIC